MYTPNKYLILGILISFILLLANQTVFGREHELGVETLTQVDPNGNVTIQLQIKNESSKTLFDIHPMFHFHHNMSMMPMIHKLNPGETRSIMNKKHPRVLRVGRYPLVTVIRYALSLSGSVPLTMTKMDAFYYQEKLDSLVEGSLNEVEETDGSHLKIFIKNTSESFKNIRLMLLLPPGIRAERFDKGIMGLTIRGGEERFFDVPIHKPEGFPSGDFPVHLMIEYGQMLKHYSKEVAGIIHVRNTWNEIPWISHLIAFSLLLLLLVFVCRFKTKSSNAEPAS